MNIKKVLISPYISLKEAMAIIDSGAIKIAFVVDADNKLLGTITDGDIRRAILKGKNLEESINDIYNTNPFYVYRNYSKRELINYCTKNKIYQIPVVDKNKKITDIIILDELLKPKSYPNKVVLMVGGLGTRLRPLTEKVPKPMLEIGNKPILEIIVDNFKRFGFENFIFCVNYKYHIIEDYFQDGEKLGVNIEYVYEEKRMGTAGALSLLKEKPNEPFFVMNGDLLTNVNFESFLEFHNKNKASASMGVREYTHQIPFGVVEMDGINIKNIKEKPVIKKFVNAGIYVLDPHVLEYIPKNEYFDMPTLFEKIINDNKKVVSFPIREYWLDIGRMEEYKKAIYDYEEVFG